MNTKVRLVQSSTFYEYTKQELPFSLETAKRFKLFLDRNGLKDVFNISLTNIEAQNYVGVIKYKDYQFEILPKLLAKDQKDKEAILKNLFYMLSYTKKLEIKETDFSKLAKSVNPFLEVLIGNFANSLYDSLLRYIPKNYVLQEENIRHLKGKLKFNEQIKYNTTNKARFYCAYDEFCEDNLLNQTFNYVTLMLSKITTNPANRKRLKQIANIYSEITFTPITAEKIKHLKLRRNQKAFEKPFILAKMFIENSSIEMSSKKFNTIALVWDMNQLFEEFVYMLLKKKYEQIEAIDESSNVEYQKNEKLIESSEKYLIDEDGYPVLTEEKNRSCKSTFSDIVLNLNDGTKLIVDTKYKNNSGQRADIKNADIYQILAYKEIHSEIHPRLNEVDIEERDIPNAVLLYPKDKEHFIWRHHVNGSRENQVFNPEYDNKFFVSCISLDVDLKEDLRKTDSQIIREINSLIKLVQTPSYCPKCKSKHIVEIMYGYPSYEAVKLEEQGKIVLGGCERDLDNPQWHCKSCENDF